MPRVRYRLSFSALHAHLVDVEARFRPMEKASAGPLELSMAAWTPGSYLIREYARHVQELAVTDGEGRPLACTKTAKDRWRVEAGGAAEVVVRYRVYGWDLTVRTNHIDDTHAFLNGAPTFLFVEALRGEAAEVVLEPPAGWTVATALPGGPTRFEARDLDELIDSPIHLGEGEVRELRAAGKPLRLAAWGRVDGATGRLDDLGRDLEKVVEAHARVFGGVPYDRYTFLLMLAPGAYGGLEHRASSAILGTSFAFATRKSYEELLELLSHEFFHTWNVKRIHPRALGPFDYGREAYTRSLWVMEGLTSYYDRYTLRRAGLLPVKRYLDRLLEDWGKLLAIPGRARQSMEESSFDAWIKLYRPDENTVNSTVSYYLKGSLVCLTLDLEIRRRSGGARSLDDVLVHLWRKYGQKGVGFEDADVEREFSAATELDLGDLFAAAVHGREDPDLAGALLGAGLVLKASHPKDEDGDAPPPWLGINTRAVEGRPVVASVLAGGPAERAGVYAGDEILAIDGFRVDDRSLERRVAARKPDDALRLTVFRRDELRDVEVILAERPKDKLEIVPVDDPTPAQQALHQAWLGEPHPKER